MKNRIRPYLVIAWCTSLQACSSPVPAVDSPDPGLVALPSFELGGSKQGADLKVTLNISGMSLRRILYLTSDIQNVSLSLYDSTGTKFPSGGLIKTNSASQTALTSSTKPDYFADILTELGIATASYDLFMIRQATGSAGFTGSTYAATFKYLKDGSYTLVAEAAEIDSTNENKYTTIGRVSANVTLSPLNRDSGSYTTITVPTLNMTLDDNPILNATVSISDGPP